jgi:hypothetical protein
VVKEVLRGSLAQITTEHKHGVLHKDEGVVAVEGDSWLDED